MGRLILWAGLTFIGLSIAPAWAFDSADPVRNNFGGVGMIDMPTARMAPDGALSFDGAFFQNTQRYDLGFQALPWLETDIRYSGLSHFNTNFPVYWDRSFAVKARLWQESETLPAIAIGIDDLIGTGIYSGEYLVGSKQFGPLDFTLGIGWGRLGSTDLFKNPIASIIPSFDKSRTFPGAGGTAFSSFFNGHDSGLFGGVTWRTPVDRLTLIAEYSSDTYQAETLSGNFSPRNQVNLGLAYRVTDSIQFGLSWLYGRSIGGNVSFELDPTTDPYPRRIGPPLPSLPTPRSPQQQQQALELMLDSRGSLAPPARRGGEFVDALWKRGDLKDAATQGDTLVLKLDNNKPQTACQAIASSIAAYSLTIRRIEVANSTNHASCAVNARVAGAAPNVEAVSYSAGAASLVNTIMIDATKDARIAPGAAIAKIIADARNQRINIDAIDFAGYEAVIYYNNQQYFSETDALNRLIRLSMNDAPPDIEKFRFICTQQGVAHREFDVLRGPAERSIVQENDIDLSTDATAQPAPMQSSILARQARYPRFSWNIFPQFRQELFDPSNPLGVQLLAAAAGTVNPLPGISLNGEVEASIWDNFNVNRVSDSLLPHVRTDFTKYFTKGKNGIGYLDANYDFRISPTIFATLKAGYLESMFAGVGGEVLWRPEMQRWALGADLYEVQQRDFERLFGLQSYRAFTGHVSLYYQSPWYDLNFLVRAGQYLAGDRGITFEMSRSFSTGVEIGAFFAKTNVSSTQFGEGSFDKGIILRIPIGWTLPTNSQNELYTVLRPVQRDGGQTLDGDATLYDRTRREYDVDLPD